MESVKEAGGVGKGKKSDKRLNNKMGEILAQMMPEDEVPESLKGKIDAVIGTMVDEYAAADSKEEKNRLQDKLKKLLPDKIFTWEDVKERMEGENVSDWDEKFAAMATAAREGIGEKGTEIITSLIDPISKGVADWTAPAGTFGAKVSALVGAGINAVSMSVPRLKVQIDAYVGQLNRIKNIENEINARTAGGGNEGTTTGGTDDEGGGGAGLSFAGNAAGYDREAAGGAGLSFAGNMAALDGASMAAMAAPMPPVGGGMDMPSDFGGGLYSRMGGGGSGSEQNIYVQNMSVMGENDEMSVLSQFAFMDPGGGGNA
jgi:hypothetical protein